MAFSFGNMMKAAGSNFMKNMGSGGGSAPILNSEGADISAAFGPQGGGGGAPPLKDILGKLGSMFGGGDDQAPAPAPAAGGDALAQLLASIGQQGASALGGASSLPARGAYRADPGQPVFAPRRGFGFRSY